jgi:16S rRNA (cytosine1402-N4)-methyltransferase
LNSHVPVLLNRVLETLGDIAGKTIIDATFGAGGYSGAFLEHGANIVAFDRDPTVMPFAEKLKEQYGDKFKFMNAPFSQITNHVPASAGMTKTRITHIVFDLGVSSMQIDTPGRGFSWRFDAPLDMRMGGGITAAELIEISSADEIAKILADYGDVARARVIARAIKDIMPKTTFQLRDLIYNPKDTAPVFQALRIAANDELGEIERAMAAAPSLLPIGGICACATFHSIEDRLVKSIFREWAAPIGDPRMPVAPAPFEMLKTFRPDADELSANPRARSSHLRAVKKIYNMNK